MESKTKTQHEQNNSKPLGIQKIEARILFGNSGPWSESFKTLLAMGIDVQKLYEENASLKKIIALKNETCDIYNKLVSGYQRRILDLQGEIIGQYTNRTYAPHLRVLTNED